MGGRDTLGPISKHFLPFQPHVKRFTSENSGFCSQLMRNFSAVEKSAKKTGRTASARPEIRAPPRSKIHASAPTQQPFLAPRPPAPRAFGHRGCASTARPPPVPRGSPRSPGGSPHTAACARVARAAGLSLLAQHLLLCRKTLSSRNAPQSLIFCSQLWLDLHRLHPLRLRRVRPLDPADHSRPTPHSARPRDSSFSSSQPKIT